MSYHGINLNIQVAVGTTMDRKIDKIDTLETLLFEASRKDGRTDTSYALALLPTYLTPTYKERPCRFIAFVTPC